MNEKRLQATVAKLENLFQLQHQTEETPSSIRRKMALRLGKKLGDALEAVAAEEVSAHIARGEVRWSTRMRTDPLYRLEIWRKVVERTIASEGSP